MGNKCEHASYSIASKMVFSNVSDLNIKQLLLKVRVVCANCKQPYVFKGDAGFSTTEPKCSPDGSELRIPLDKPSEEEDEEGSEEEHVVN